MSTIKIGSTVWVFDKNRRVYPPKQPGDIWSKGNPIYREHFVPAVITDETSRSWIIGSWNRKVPKNGPHEGYAFTEQEVDDACWANDHRYKLVQHIERLRDIPLLKKIAEVSGFKP